MAQAFQFAALFATMGTTLTHQLHHLGAPLTSPARTCHPSGRRHDTDMSAPSPADRVPSHLSRPLPCLSCDPVLPFRHPARHVSLRRPARVLQVSCKPGACSPSPPANCAVLGSCTCGACCDPPHFSATIRLKLTSTPSLCPGRQPFPPVCFRPVSRSTAQPTPSLQSSAC